MPELPEVETIKRDLQRKILGKKICKVEVIQKKSIKNSSGKFVEILKGNYITDVGRKGKLLILKLKDGNYLLAHLRMTGQLVCRKENGEEGKSKHTRVIIYFCDQSRLDFNDIRRFGYLMVATEVEKNNIIERIGADPTSESFDLKMLKRLLEGRKRSLKSALLDQKMIGGIGNIYADEICFSARLVPSRRVNSLGSREIQRLYASMKKVLSLAVRYRGTTFSSYVDASGKKGDFAGFLKVYRREGKKCLRCKKGIVKKIKLAGRSTRYCRNCQV